MAPSVLEIGLQIGSMVTPSTNLQPLEKASHELAKYRETPTWTSKDKVLTHYSRHNTVSPPERLHYQIFLFTLRWHHNERDGISNHQPNDFFYRKTYSGADQRKHQSSASLAFVRGIHRWPVNSRTNVQKRGKCFHLMTSSWIGASVPFCAQWYILARKLLEKFGSTATEFQGRFSQTSVNFLSDIDHS